MRASRPLPSAQLTKIGWWLFVVSALLFGWSAVRARDWFAAAGAAAFLLANLSFMAALRRDERGRNGEDRNDEERAGAERPGN